VPAEEVGRICERRRRTGWSPRRLAEEPDIARPHSTIHQVLRRGDCSRRPRPRRPAVVRYELPCPGQLLPMDVKKLGRFEAPGHVLTADRTKRSRSAGWEYVHSIVDDCSRLAYSEIHADERAATVTAFTRRALDWFLEQGIAPERLMTDNAFAYTQSHSFKRLLRRRAIRHIRTRPYTPRTNGKVERFHQTLHAAQDARVLERAVCDTREPGRPALRASSGLDTKVIGPRPPDLTAAGHLMEERPNRRATISIRR
jgi:transposase InsO family protein